MVWWPVPARQMWIRPSRLVRLKLSSIPEKAHERRRAWVHAHLMRLLCRGLDPSVLARDEVGLRRPLIDLINVRACLRRPVGRLALRQAYSTSDSINAAPQAHERRRGFDRLSAFSAGAWSRLDEGWEAREHADRRRWLIELRARLVDSSVAPETMATPADDGHLRLTEPADFAYDPHVMLRSWNFW